MKYSVSNYVKAFVEIAADLKPLEMERALSSFVNVVSKNGDLPHMDKIVDEIHRELVTGNGGRWVELEVAGEASIPLLEKFTKSFSSKDHVANAINSSLVAGVRITIDREYELDNSLSGKLKKMFHG